MSEKNKGLTISIEDTYQKNLNELKRIHNKLVYISSVIFPSYVLLLLPILIISFLFYIYLIFIWLIGVFVLYMIIQHLNFQQSNLTYKCWYPENIFQSDLDAFYYVLLAFNLVIIIFCIFTYLYFGISFINNIVIISYIILINSIFPIIVYMRRKHFKNINSEAKHFKLKIDRLENFVEKVVKDNNIQFQTIQKKSIWKPSLVIFKLDNALEIEVFQGYGNGIRIKPVKAKFRKLIDKIQQSLDKYIQLMD